MELETDLRLKKNHYLSKNFKLDKNTNNQLCTFLIEYCKNDDVRIYSVKSLYKLNSQGHFKLLENLLISDLNKHIRIISAKLIIENYLNRGLIPLKWALKNDKSLEVVSNIISIFKKKNKAVLYNILKEIFKEIIQNKKSNAKDEFVKIILMN